jgi:hypothetical protein
LERNPGLLRDDRHGAGLAGDLDEPIVEEPHDGLTSGEERFNVERTARVPLILGREAFTASRATPQSRLALPWLR